MGSKYVLNEKFFLGYSSKRGVTDQVLLTNVKSGMCFKIGSLRRVGFVPETLDVLDFILGLGDGRG